MKQVAGQKSCSNPVLVWDMGAENFIRVFVCGRVFDFYGHMHQNRSGPTGPERDFLLYTARLFVKQVLPCSGMAHLAWRLAG